jgi:hypothetical protein
MSQIGINRINQLGILHVFNLDGYYNPLTRLFKVYEIIKKRGEMKRRIILSLITLSLVLGISSLVHAVFYVFTGIDVPGSQATEGNGINVSGETVGSFTDVDETHGFFRNPNGFFAVVDDPSGFETKLQAMNVSKQLVRSFNDFEGVEHGFLYNTCTFKTIDVPNSTGTKAEAINPDGVIVGHFTDLDERVQGFEASPHL